MRRALQVFFGVLFAGLIIFAVTREPRKPALPRWEQQDTLMEISGLKVRLKAEFQASNRDLYKEPSVLEMRESVGKDGGG